MIFVPVTPKGRQLMGRIVDTMEKTAVPAVSLHGRVILRRDGSTLRSKPGWRDDVDAFDTVQAVRTVGEERPIASKERRFAATVLNPGAPVRE